MFFIRMAAVLTLVLGAYVGSASASPFSEWFFVIDCDGPTITRVSTGSTVVYEPHLNSPGGIGFKAGFFVQGLDTDPSLLTWIEVSRTQDSTIYKGNILGGPLRDSEIYFLTNGPKLAIAIWKSGKRELLTYCHFL
ncbi:hypothetical protein HFO39_14155 [Rhizobium leguminosarum]|uniref:hypothetical protein n=1 Tax=Rhizobium leguminosarum TaxID=384 RepID=UPI001C94EDA5|nr:hypothetical protein [Rhizobium leguminosarum]MBY5635912.1 hypothetical protein [Rhizobium leguminosarum]